MDYLNHKLWNFTYRLERLLVLLNYEKLFLNAVKELLEKEQSYMKEFISRCLLSGRCPLSLLDFELNKLGIRLIDFQLREKFGLHYDNSFRKARILLMDIQDSCIERIQWFDTTLFKEYIWNLIQSGKPKNNKLSSQ